MIFRLSDSVGYSNIIKYISKQCDTINQAVFKSETLLMEPHLFSFSKTIKHTRFSLSLLFKLK